MSKDDCSISSSLVNGATSSDDDHDRSAFAEWLIISIVYGLVSFQLLIAVSVGAVVVSHSGISHFVLHTGSGLAIYIISILLWFIGRGKTVLEAVIFISILAVTLTLYSIFAMIKNLDFSLAAPCCFLILLLISIYVPIQVN
ncbi:hypothetical protein COLO4_09851 [Corchorus olitorius]|uniref:Uncharacterized protein n=1 Tax=Corchorus olitorius TaxID=93759 RepID=A0A1R3KAU0_9ROSI|nr:hypothetical protein COLO4_09851 [Corchorus olitorius]